MAANAKLVCSLLHVRCHPMVPGTSRWTWWSRRRDFGEWEGEGWVRRASRQFSTSTRHSWCKSLKCSPGWMPPPSPSSPRASPPYYIFAVLLLWVYWKLNMCRGEACPNGEPLKRTAGHGETADSQSRKEAFCVDNYRVFDEFSSLDRVRIWASAKLLDDGGGGRRRNSSRVFSSASPLAQLFWARETHHKHGSFWYFDLRSLWSAHMLDRNSTVPVFEPLNHRGTFHPRGEHFRNQGCDGCFLFVSVVCPYLLASTVPVLLAWPEMKCHHRVQTGRYIYPSDLLI